MIYTDGQVLADSVVYAAVANTLIGYLKKAKWFPWLNGTTFYLNRFAAITTALIATFGINYSHSYTSDGVLTITLTGLTLVGMLAGLKQFIVSYAIQQGSYHLTKTDYSENQITIKTHELGIDK